MAFSKRLFASYVFDWACIVIIAIVAALLTKISPNHRPFNLADPTLSFPHTEPETVRTYVLVIVGLAAPALIIFIICLTLIPGPTVSKGTPKGLVWRRKFWEWNTGWMGLGLTLAATLLITNGMKLLFGKPRPDLIARCDPDLDKLEDFIVGGLGDKVLNGIYLVSWRICRQTDRGTLDDGFMSFPSGHASFSWAGMTYLFLFLCAKFAITVPYLLPAAYSSSAFRPHTLTESELNSKGASPEPLNSRQPSETIPLSKVLRSQAAAPPAYLLGLACVPIFTAVYITATRFTDYRHHGFDLIFGSLIGFFTAYGSFRWYHAPINRGAGWAWGPRTPERAFAIGVGMHGYAGDDHSKKSDEVVLDLETGEEGIPRAPGTETTNGEGSSYVNSEPHAR